MVEMVRVVGGSRRAEPTAAVPGSWNADRVRQTGRVSDPGRLFDVDVSSSPAGPEPGAGRRSGVVRPELPDADLTYLPRFFADEERRRLKEALTETTAWRQDAITMYGRPVAI